MKELSKLMDFRPSIKVVDATLRDGGLVNYFYGGKLWNLIQKKL